MAEHICYYIVYSGYTLDVEAKLFECESPFHEFLRCANGCLVDQVFMVIEYINFLSKQDFLELFEKLTIDRSSFSVVVYFNCSFEGIQLKMKFVYYFD